MPYVLREIVWRRERGIKIPPIELLSGSGVYGGRRDTSSSSCQHSHDLVMTVETYFIDGGIFTADQKDHREQHTAEQQPIMFHQRYSIHQNL